MPPAIEFNQHKTFYKLRSVFSFVVFLLFIFLFVNPNQSQAATKGKAPSNKSDYDSMMSLAQSKGELPVIIKLKVSLEAEGKLAKPSIAAQQQKLYASQAALLNKLSKYKPKRVKHFDHLPFTAMRLSADGLKAAMLNSEVVAIYEDKLSRPTLADSSPLIGATAAANSGFSGQGQTVAILDTGVDKTHSFLAGRVVHEACFSQTITSQASTTVCPNGGSSQIGTGAGVPCSSSINGCNHGTHVAGIAAGKGSSFSGVAKDSGIMAIQVFSQFTGSSNCGNSSPCALSYTSDQISALEHVYSQRGNFNIASVNMSLGGGQFTSACDGDPRKVAIDLLRSAGIATVVSSGNEGFTNSIGAPACISSAISVGSTTKTDSVSSFSNSASSLDLLAPGSSINSSIPGNVFSFFSGTSMAAPQVTGAFAVLKSRLPSASVDQIENTLKSTGAGVLDSRNGITKPRIKIDSALAVLVPPTVPTLFVSPTDGFSVVGPLGGPFSPASRSFTLSNITSSGQSLSYSISGIPSWLQLGSASSGSIPAGGSITISVSVKTSVANGLPLGTQSGNIIFTNTTNSAGNLTVPTSLLVSGNNDFFVNAIPLGQSGERFGSTQGSNTTASIESGEPNHAKVSGQKSVWWKWSAPSNGDITIDTFGSGFDTTLGIYTGTVVSALSEVTSNDDENFPTIVQSNVSFAARAGITYYIAVDGFTGESGDITLNWRFTSDSTPTPNISILPATDVTFTGASTGPFSPSSTSYSITNVGSGNQPVAITTPPWLTASTTGFTLTPGNTVSVSFSVNSQAGVMPPGIYSGIIDFGLTARAVVLNLTSGVLTNDNYQNAIRVANGSQMIAWNNNLASKQTGEPDHAANVGGKSVWWKLTAIGSGNLAVNTEGSTFDTTLAVYTGNNVSQLTTIQSNDDSGIGLTSSLTIPVVSGTTYYIAVDGYNADSGSLQLNITSDKVANNDFNADGKADILWRNSVSGDNYLYFMNGATLNNHGAINTVSDLNWKIAGTSDFNADGNSDILWRHAVTGENYLYMMGGTGIISHGPINTVSDPDWKIAGTSDFNADGNGDILWRNAVTGQNYLYMMNGAGIISHGPINTVSDPGWKIVGLGDFNGDEKSDILWRHSTLGYNLIYLMDGTTITSTGFVNIVDDLNWKIEGIADFDNNGTADIFWRHALTGLNVIYLMNGTSITNTVVVNVVSDLNWKIAGLNDLNGDGTSDILWRHAITGLNFTYLINNASISSSGSINIVDPAWKIISD